VTDSALLETSDLAVSFGGLRAVDGVSLRVEAGTVVGLIGPNGAGKSTLIDAVTGFVPISGGSVTFDGSDITRVAPHRRARRGLVRTFQSLELFGDLDVAENIAVPTTTGNWRQNVLALVSPRRRSGDDRVDAMVHRMDLASVREATPDALSQAARRNLVLGRALVGDPQLLLLDEPAAGLDAAGAAALGQRLRALASDGTAVLLVDHDMHLVLGACDQVYVIEAGRIIARGTPGEVRRDREVLRAYLGEEPSSATAATRGSVV
jgi:branched-chain amino acid transport system ATP-binding protein